FEEPLIATEPTTTEEDAALTAAIASFQHPATAQNDFADSAQPFLDYMAKYPASGWNMAIQTNLGLGYYHAGYFSRAFTAWEQAWSLGRDKQSLEAKRLTDRAVGELARMHARVGHADKLEALFATIGDRKVTGSATEMVAGAHEGLWIFHNDPGIAYLCGSKALVNVLRALKASPDKINVVDNARSGEHGFNLAQVSKLADQAALAHKLIHRKAGQPIPVPSVVNWKVNHYAAIVAAKDGKFQIKDPTFASGDLLMSQAAIDSESSGYFLVPTTHSPINKKNGWREVAPQSGEAEAVYGMGYTSSNNPAVTPEDQAICHCAKPPAPGKAVDPKTPVGMSGYNIYEMAVSLNITDVPIGYKAAKGSPVYLALAYNQRESYQPAIPSFFNVSPKWTLNWLSYIKDNVNNPGYQVSRYVGGGGGITYPYFDSTTGIFAAELQTHAVLVRIPASGALVAYELYFPDGSKQVFGQSDGTVKGVRRVFLTKVVDPQGNATTLNYDAQLRLTGITDATGKTTSFSYTHSNPLLVTKITDPFGRFTSLGYDTNQRLSSITDPIGIVSSFGYNTRGFLNQLDTPYGTSSFSYNTDTGNTRWLEAKDALGFSERVEYLHTPPGIAFSDPVAKVPKGINRFN
ncbi:MAG: cysteine peptidase family C39 domain-containing protein, partial [Methylovulum sp.]|nr:cysteine peptidase family C39 domain-containing protein [Methylovulum sp.]